ncbi:hypothetical protein BKA69DRAFT_1090539, partial [Paraphysoderma sedebokerense]
MNLEYDNISDDDNQFESNQQIQSDTEDTEDTEDPVLDNQSDDHVEDMNPDNYDDNGINRTKYPVSLHQQAIYLSLYPAADADISVLAKARHCRPPFIVQSYQLKEKVDPDIFLQVTKKVRDEYAILRTKFFVNELIIDADVEGLIKAASTETPTHRKDTPTETSEYFEFRTLDTTITSVTKVAQEWVSRVSKLDQLFKIIMLECQSPTDSSDTICLILTLFSTSIADDNTASFISHEILSAYLTIQRSITTSLGENPGSVIDLVSSYTSKELLPDYVDYAYKMAQISPSLKKVLPYFRNQCFESRQDFLDFKQRENLEQQIRKSTIEKRNIESHREALIKHQETLAKELTDTTQQRKKLDESSTPGNMTTYHDSITGEYIPISVEAKQTLIKSVLGEEATGDNVDALLTKHEVPAEIRDTLNATKLSLETFAGITENELATINVAPKQRKKLLALSEYVRNRVKECLEEQSRFKYSLERKALKCKRDIDHIVEGLKKKQIEYDKVCDNILKCEQTLNPPFVETPIPPVILPEHGFADRQTILEKLEAKNLLPKDYESFYGFYPLNISPSRASQLRKYHREYEVDQKRHKLHQRRPTSKSNSPSRSRPHRRSRSRSRSPTREPKNFSPYRENRLHLHDQHSSDSDSDGPEHYHSERDKLINDDYRSLETVFLSVYSVLLKHISGFERFLIGYDYDGRNFHRAPKIIAGPLIHTVPYRFDLVQPNLSFYHYFGRILRHINKHRKLSISCPISSMREKFGLPLDLPVRFRYFSQIETEKWLSKGLQIDDLLFRPGFSSDNFDSTSYFDDEEFRSRVGRLFSIQEDDLFDLRLVMVEYEGGVYGGFKYRKDKFDELQIAKWAEKFEFILDNIEIEVHASMSGRRLTIATLISRFYHSVWSSKVDISGT